MTPELKEYLEKRNVKFLKKVTDVRNKHSSPDLACLREQAKDEMIFEVDSEDKTYVAKRIRTLIKRLTANNYNYFLYDHKGKSPHVHVYDIKGLDSLDIEIVKEYRKQMIRKYLPDSDPSFAKSVQLVALEERPHFKYGTVKKLIRRTDGFSNEIEPELLFKATEQERKVRTMQSFGEKTLENDWLITFVLNEFNEYKHLMDLILFKNIAIDIVNRGLDVNKYIDLMSERFGLKVKGQMMGWINWARESPRHINHIELKRFFEMYDIDYKKVSNKWAELLKK